MDKLDYTYEIIPDDDLYTLYVADKNGLVIFKQCYLKNITPRTNVISCAEAYITRMKRLDEDISFGVECVKGGDLTL
ncbi:hypothetical protein [Pseudoalteromonas phage PH357]|nr:hypothetical protein [Pseudoalteromonas phage PH357]